MKKIPLIFSFLTICTTLSAKNITYKDSFSKNIQIIDIALNSESIDIINTSGDDFSIEIDCNNKKYQPVVKYDDNKIEIYAKKNITSFTYRCKVELCIPENIIFNKLIVETSSGKIDIDTIKSNDIKVFSSSGSINIESLSTDYNAVIKSTSGSINIEKIKADISKIESTSGSINIEKIDSYDVFVNSTSGSVNIEKNDSESIDVKAVSGSINLDDIFTSYFNVKTTSGSINLDLADVPLATSNIISTSGSIHLYIPKSKGFDLIYQTNSGMFRDRFNSNSFSPRHGEYSNSYFGGGPEINIQTTSGSLELDD